MTCFDCIYFETCDDSSLLASMEECCPAFKNKHDFVEVVRCKDCAKRGTDECPFHIKGTFTSEDELEHYDDDYCSYGARKKE